MKANFIKRIITFSILFFLVFCVGAKAQKDTIPVAVKGIDTATLDYSFRSYSFSNQLITVNDLLEYQRERYNDSTKECYWFFCDSGCVDFIFCDCDEKYVYDSPESPRCKTRFIHKDATLEGFIMYLRRKYN